MIPPPGLGHLPRGMVAPTVCSLLLLAGLVPLSVAGAGDRDAPDTLILDGPPEQSLTPTADFRFDSNAAQPRYRCALDGAAFQSCGPTFHLGNLPPGDHELSVYVIDLATGRYDRSLATWAWVVQDPNPAVGGSGP
ncbi:hypothetical protein DRW03_15460 [Corallococcus sp. H22C18031201]|uniref:hypothetical protein n=1 Tax=Citreicoccus inhibens TaxID=2849499 RepID=UPI000E7559BA|nr:hypothetical protein [Citreicoccus inhibens]MBU8900893.1 hypothetical protein [Citreicoccus inhibens]RJS21743.1 hypothetical protein DRW03_15460 [Corallococcus sp. H22C18031201]